MSTNEAKSRRTEWLLSQNAISDHDDYFEETFSRKAKTISVTSGKGGSWENFHRRKNGAFTSGSRK